MTPVMKLLVCAIGSLAFAFASAFASEPTPPPDSAHQSLPAVDGVNAKLSFAGITDDADALSAIGAVTFPLGHRFGLQFDGAVAGFDGGILGDIPVYGGATHLFWRDPSRGMLGLYGDVIHIDLFDGFNIFAAGVEGALYLDRVSIDAVVGFNEGDIRDADFFNRVRLSYYPIDNLSLHVGHGFAHDRHSLLYGIEWSPHGHRGLAPSFFLSGGLHDDGSNVIETGVRIYFGQRDKTLIRRHREDDPPTVQLSLNVSGVVTGNNPEQRIVVGGITAYFLEPPEIDADLINLVNILDVDPRRVAFCLKHGC